ncbi:hypothetical protein J2Z44_004265 [Clostridium punense]|uniref:Uncharacterized protein n=1 Tax=Clostridium punense TaxID=1054297 RepID=A0ABS4KAW5_9CLOT|nr:hypothetical protein M918_21980 [Clostridium sp. BL8]MBP2024396.1 hypothetical protein [Clostridium punense]
MYFFVILFHNCAGLIEENIIKNCIKLNERNKPNHFDEIFNATKVELILNPSASGEKEF